MILSFFLALFIFGCGQNSNVVTESTFDGLLVLTPLVHIDEMATCTAPIILNLKTGKSVTVDPELKKGDIIRCKDGAGYFASREEIAKYREGVGQ